jgi:hypothetical protein
MADGPPGIRWVFTRHGDNLDHLFCRKGGGRPRAWGIGEGLHDYRGEGFVTASVGFYLLQLSGAGAPPPAPHVYRPTIEVQLAHDVALGGSRLEGQKNLGPPHQTLGTGLTAGNLLQAGPLSCGQLDPGGDGEQGCNSGGHTSFLSQELGHFWLIDYHAALCMDTSAKHH